MKESTAALLDWTMHRIGHEIRNDLNALQTSNHLLLHAQLTAGDREMLVQNAATIQAIGVLVELAVRTSDLRSGKVLVKPANPVAVLQEVAASMRRIAAVQCLAQPESNDTTVAIDRGLLAWALSGLIRSGFQPMPRAQTLCLDLERRGTDIALIVAGAELRPFPAGEPWHDAARSIAVHRADLELLLVREAAMALGGRLEGRADRQPPAWTIVLSTS